MYETYEYTEKKREKEIKRQQFSANYFGVLLTLGFNILFYIIALLGSLSLDSTALFVASWPILGLLIVEIVAVVTSAILEIFKANSLQNRFKAGIFKSIARLSGFLVGVGLIVHSAIAGMIFGPANTLSVIEGIYGGISIVIGLPMFIWSVFHLSMVTSSKIDQEPKAKKKNDDIVVDATESSFEKSTANTSTSTVDAIEVEVHDINEA